MRKIPRAHPRYGRTQTSFFIDSNTSAVELPSLFSVHDGIDSYWGPNVAGSRDPEPDLTFVLTKAVLNVIKSSGQLLM